MEDKMFCIKGGQFGCVCKDCEKEFMDALEETWGDIAIKE